MRRRPVLAALGAATWTAVGGAPAARATGDPSRGALVPPSSLPQQENPALGISHRPLRFPADHGAHPDTHVEWWYVTGWLRRADAQGVPATAAGDAAHPPDFGFQVTFFRRRTGIATTSTSRFAARQLVFAHVALTELAAAHRSGNGAAGDTRPDGGSALLHDQRIARAGFGIAEVPAATGSQVARLHDWTLVRAAVDPAAPPGLGTLAITVRADHFALELVLRGTQPLLLQGEEGFSQKGPLPRQASHYYSEPQLAVQGRVQRGADAGSRPVAVTGGAWLDHEWSDEYLPPEAVGWDWIGFNLFDGGALMVFRLRRPDGGSLWGGGSHRDARGALRNFAADELRFLPLRTWTSPRTRVRYPVEWRIETPVGAFRVAALADDQELDSRGSTGALYWEGLSALHGEDGSTLGWGYLELTGYAERLRI
jgi:predicted secreted hydrolase